MALQLFSKMATTRKVHLVQGTLQGSVGKNFNLEEFYQFFGIPYAQAPLGDLRFKAPLPPKKWDNVLDATREPEMCYSLSEITGKITGSEDCLFLNVYTRQLPSAKERNLKPVMVWIHGGAFVRGMSSTALYGPEFLMTEDIVLVTLQYRLGILGFLRLRDPSFEIYGNAGLKDQSMALKWVTENISSFCGDPKNITVFGESAGGTSVNYQMLSPMSSGLFHKAIVQSGSAIKGWDECCHDPVAIAKIVDDNISSEREALDLFMRLPVEELYEIQTKYLMERDVGSINKQFGPVVEHPESKNPFLTKSPIDIIISGEYNKVPIITGYNNNEGMLFDYYRIMNPKRIMTIDAAIPYFFHLKNDSPNRKELEKKIKDFYFKNGNYDQNLRDLLGDVTYVTATFAMALNHAKTSGKPVYLYRCTLDTSINYLKNKIGLSHVPGTCHFDEVSYLFNNINTIKKLKPQSQEERSIRRMVKLWTNFAKYDNPTPDYELGVVWETFSESEKRFLNIGENLYAGVNSDKERIEFWTEIFRQYEITKFFL